MLIASSSRLRAALPHAAAAAPVRRAPTASVQPRVERADRRQRQPPQRRAAIEAQHRLEAQRHQQPRPRAPSQRAAAVRRTARAAAARDRSAPARAASRQQQRRIVELGIGRARDHRADLAPAAIGPDADRRGRVRPSQIGPCALHQRAQRAIVDQRVADRRDAAGRAPAPRAAPACSRPPPPPSWRADRFTAANG